MSDLVTELFLIPIFSLPAALNCEEVKTLNDLLTVLKKKKAFSQLLNSKTWILLKEERKKASNLIIFPTH